MAYRIRITLRCPLGLYLPRSAIWRQLSPTATLKVTRCISMQRHLHRRSRCPSISTKYSTWLPMRATGRSPTPIVARSRSTTPTGTTTRERTRSSKCSTRPTTCSETQPNGRRTIDWVTGSTCENAFLVVYRCGTSHTPSRPVNRGQAARLDAPRKRRVAAEGRGRVPRRTRTWGKRRAQRRVQEVGREADEREGVGRNGVREPDRERRPLDERVPADVGRRPAVARVDPPARGPPTPSVGRLLAARSTR